MSPKIEFNKLCERCTNVVAKVESMFDGKSRNDNFLKARVDFHSFEQWKENASWCHICALSFHNLGRGGINFLQTFFGSDRRVETTVHVDIELSQYSPTVELRFMFGNMYNVAWLYCVIQRDGSAPVILNLSDSSQTWGAKSKVQVLEWLKNCRENHTVCNNESSRLCSQAARQLPKRLLQIGSSDGQKLPTTSEQPHLTVRLRDSHELSPDTQYVTLSHCWSRYPAITLTKETLDSFYSHVPLMENKAPGSRTFKDVVNVVNDLDFSYLWIDALCIVQNDPNDKDDQISIMDEIYVNAEFNISATAAESGSWGLIHPRNPISVEPFRRVVYSQSGLSSELVVYSNNWREEVERGFVNSRAWVFQERMLAPRIVHFTRDQIFWECPTIKAAQSFPRGTLYEVLFGPYFKFNIKNWFDANVLYSPDNCKIVQEIWALLVDHYSRTDLSLKEDKLPAISGVARRLRRLCGAPDNCYLAGLWRPNLVHELLWTIPDNTNSYRSKAYWAPSWSWASVNAETNMNKSQPMNCAVRLVDVNVKTKTSDPFGKVLNASIKLSGPLCIVTCIMRSTEGLLLAIGEKNCKREVITMYWDCPLSSWHSGESPTPRQEIFPDKPVYLMPFYGYPQRHKSWFIMNGLILSATDDNVGQYLRLGMFMLTSDHPEAHEVLVEACQSKTLGVDSYLEFDGADKYCIEII